MPTQADKSKSLDELSPTDWFPYATYIPGRTNGDGWNGGYDYRRHKTLGQAKSAISGSRFNSVADSDNAKIYQYDVQTEKWVEV
jgi:hypothetical protein